jgi:hypothetical protein
MVLTVAGSRDWAAVVIRRAWLTVTWSSSRTARRALPEPLPVSAWASTVAAFRTASGVRVNPASRATVAKMAATWPAV